MVNLEKIVVEWSYRLDRGYPKIHKEEDRKVLKNILTEKFGSEVASLLIENIRGELEEVALGLNNESFRHENMYKEYLKIFIEKLKQGGDVVLEKTVRYPEANVDEPSPIELPEGATVDIDNTDDIIGKMIAALRGMVKYGPKFPEDNEEAQKALKRAEKLFMKEDGEYKRIIPVIADDSKVYVKLNDLSKDTVVKELEDEENGKNSETSSSEKFEPEDSKNDLSDEEIEEAGYTDREAGDDYVAPENREDMSPTDDELDDSELSDSDVGGEKTEEEPGEEEGENEEEESEEEEETEEESEEEKETEGEETEKGEGETEGEESEETESENEEEEGEGVEEQWTVPQAVKKSHGNWNGVVDRHSSSEDEEEEKGFK